jgi:RNA polymerase sigma-70 factor (ECF subfamily)
MDTHVSEALTAPTDRERSGALPTPRDIDLAEAAGTFVALRPRLLRIAYRVLGDAAEAEDIVQEAWLRWQRADRREVDNPPAFLATATHRLAINVVQSARTRHETAGAPWQEDPVDALVDLETTAERTSEVELALRVLLERLSPAERAAFVLRKGFDYPYGKVATILHISAANARQLVSRAYAHLDASRRLTVSLDAHRRLVRAFVTAARAGEFAQLESLLTADTRAGAA